MTIGQLVFYGGLALLGLTIIVAIVFLVKKLAYQPENPIYERTAAGRTQPLRNGYPAEKESIRHGGSKRTEPMQTAAVDNETGTAARETEAFVDETDVLSQELDTHDGKTAALFRKADTRPGGSNLLGRRRRRVSLLKFWKQHI